MPDLEDPERSMGRSKRFYQISGLQTIFLADVKISKINVCDSKVAFTHRFFLEDYTLYEIKET